VELTGRNTLESIEVELPLERRKLGLAEPPVYDRKNHDSEKKDKSVIRFGFVIAQAIVYLHGEHLINELLLFVNEKTTTVRLPRDYIVHPIGLQLA
jgi:hypothetical protein